MDSHHVFAGVFVLNDGQALRSILSNGILNRGKLLLALIIGFARQLDSLAGRICKPQWVVPRVGVEVEALWVRQHLCLEKHGVRTRKPPLRGGEVPSPEVIEAN